MSPLMSRIMLSMLMLPLAAMAYVVVIVLAFAVLGWYGPAPWFVAGLGTWAGIAAYWAVLWRREVRWTLRRVRNTWVAAAASAGVAAFVALIVAMAEDEIALFVGTALAPLLWLVATCFLWRDKAAGAAAAGPGGDVVCPSCGYSLRGLTNTRCPECGEQRTLDDLFASQPGRAAAAELEPVARRNSVGV